MNNGKIVVALKGISKIGKTETLKKLIKILLELPSGNILYQSSDKYKDAILIIKIKGLIIGVITQGDPGTELDKKLYEMKSFNCSLIFCASRTRGDTISVVKDFSIKHNFGLIWTSTYYAEIKEIYYNIDGLNELKAEQLLKLGLSILNKREIE
ncbi:MAG: hypothetical protein LBU70_06630 [Chitinispirillales bacterium]|nr:hypothetical protein [Chitinispirillales bacterium]